MFQRFSQCLYQLCLKQGFQPGGQKIEMPIQNPADFGVLFGRFIWSMQKQEQISICRLHVVDGTRVDWPQLTKERDREQNIAEETMSAYFRSVFFVYMFVDMDEDDKEKWQEFIKDAAVYEGQPVYLVYWNIDLAKQKIGALPGQPDAMFGLEKMVRKAMAEYDGAVLFDADTYTEYARRQAVKTVIRDNERKSMRRTPILAYAMTAIIAAVTALMYISGYSSNPPYSEMVTAIRFGAIVPWLVRQNGEYYRLFTAMFVHYGFMHCMMNGMGLLIFGTRVERFYGHAAFLAIYLFSGVCGSISSLIFTSGVAAGASTAVYGMVGAAFAYTAVAKRDMDRLTSYMMLIYILMGLAIGFMTPGIDNFGHIGGLAAGVALGAFITAAFFRFEQKQDEGGKPIE